jgi:hypothetical protein
MSIATVRRALLWCAVMMNLAVSPYLLAVPTFNGAVRVSGLEARVPDGGRF